MQNLTKKQKKLARPRPLRSLRPFPFARLGITLTSNLCSTGTYCTPVKHTYILLSSLGGDNEDIGDIGDGRARFSSA